jgi:hypothetical protein
MDEISPLSAAFAASKQHTERLKRERQEAVPGSDSTTHQQLQHAFDAEQNEQPGADDEAREEPATRRPKADMPWKDNTFIAELSHINKSCHHCANTVEKKRGIGE